MQHQEIKVTSKSALRHELTKLTAQRIYGNMPRSMLAGHHKRIERVVSKEEIFDYEYARLNTDWQIRYLVFDVDNLNINDYVAGSTFDVVDRGSGRYHAFYELLDPVPARKNQSKKTKELLKDVIAGYKHGLNADKAILHQKQLVKNPLSNHWLVFITGRQVTLTEMAESMPRVKPDPKPKFIFDPDSRNCTLFDTGRYFAYRAVKDCDNYNKLYDRIYEFLTEQNETEIKKNFKSKGMSPDGEVVSTTKSIAGWVWERRININANNRGIMKLDKDQPLTTRQGAGAVYTNEVRKYNTNLRIDKALMELYKEGIKNPTQSQIAEKAELNQKTVCNYFKRT